MPSRGARICTCGSVVQSGATCACRPARSREYDRSRPTSRERGYTTKWDKERRDHLNSYPYCKLCRAPAKIVDHIIPHKGDQALFWDRSNWQSLCTTCHNRRKQIIERRIGTAA